MLYSVKGRYKHLAKVPNPKVSFRMEKAIESIEVSAIQELWKTASSVFFSVELALGLYSKKLISLARAVKEPPKASAFPPIGTFRERKLVRPWFSSINEPKYPK